MSKPILERVDRLEFFPFFEQMFISNDSRIVKSHFQRTLNRLGFLRTKTKLVIWSVKSWPLNFWSVICKYLISSWSSWSLILLIFDLWWTLIRWSVKQLDLWSFDLTWSMWLIFWSLWSLNYDLSFQLEVSIVERNHWLNCLW